jgi:PTH1 family peptidyl-tRNA hydrolase
MDKENIPLENIFIITDDLNLLWNSRIKPKGSDGDITV